MRRDKNDGVDLFNLKPNFQRQIKKLFPNGLEGKTLLDCACNSGGYCFWAKEFGAESTFGFDVREKWIQQANFLRKNRTIGTSENMEFEVCDLYDIPSKNLSPFDITIFKGIFYHLPDPIAGLEIAANLTKNLIKNVKLQ